MNWFLEAYSQHAYLISFSIPPTFLIFTIIWREFSPRFSKKLHFLWLVAFTFSIAVVLLMTLSPVVPHQFTPEEIHLFAQPKPPLFPNRWRWENSWHDPMANVLLLSPMSLLVAWRFGAIRTLVFVACASGAIELVQFFYGHGRSAQISDLLLNVTGGLLSVLIVQTGTKLHASFRA